MHGSRGTTRRRARRSERWFRPLVAAAGFALAMTAPLELLYARGFGVGDLGVGAFILMTMLGMMVVDLLGTRFVPHLAARRALAVGILAFGASCLIMGGASTFWLLLAGRVVQGLGAGLLMGGGLQAAVRVYSSREQALGAFNGSLLLGSSLGAPVGGWIAGLAPGQTGYRLAFFACCLACIAVAVAISGRLPSLAPADGVVARIALPRFDGPRGLGPALVLGSVGDFLRGGVVYTALPLVGAERHLSSATIGVAVGALTGVEILMLSRAEAVLARFGAMGTIVAALGLGVCSSAVLALATGRVAFLAGSLVFGLAVAGSTVAPALLIVALTGDAATGLAQFRIASGIGMTVGSTGVAVAAGALGATRLFALIAVFLVAAAILAHSVVRRSIPVPE